MNVGDFGTELIFGTGFSGAGLDMSSFTDLVLTFTRGDNSVLAVDSSSGVALGSTNYTLPNGQVFNAHQYVTFFFLQGQVNSAGPWKVRLTYDQSTASPPISWTSNIGNFVVGP